MTLHNVDRDRPIGHVVCYMLIVESFSFQTMDFEKTSYKFMEGFIRLGYS